MVFKASENFLRRITQGDQPMSVVVSQQKDTSLPSDPRIDIGKENQGVS
jgi:hypothetical protein